MAVFVVAGFFILMGLLWWRIFAKAGYGGWMGLLAVIPGVNLLMLTILAFTEWPILAELRQSREQQRRYLP